MSRLFKVGIALGVVGALGACDTFQGASRGIPVETQVAVADGTVVVAGPRGFCVDPRSTQPASDLPFVMMGNCAAISGDGRAPQPGFKAVLTATVATLDPTVSFDSADPGLPAFFEAPAGRAALSRAGDPDTVEVLDSFNRGEVFYLHTRDTSPGPVENLDDTHWRAVFGVNGRVVSASVLDFEDSAMSPESSLGVLTQFTDRIRSQSVGRAGPPVLAQAPSPDPAPAPTQAPVQVNSIVTVAADPTPPAPIPRPGASAPAPERVVPVKATEPVFPPIGILRRIFG